MIANVSIKFLPPTWEDVAVVAILVIGFLVALWIMWERDNDTKDS